MHTYVHVHMTAPIVFLSVSTHQTYLLDKNTSGDLSHAWITPRPSNQALSPYHTNAYTNVLHLTDESDYVFLDKKENTSAWLACSRNASCTFVVLRGDSWFSWSYTSWSWLIDLCRTVLSDKPYSHQIGDLPIIIPRVPLLLEWNARRNITVPHPLCGEMFVRGPRC